MLDPTMILVCRPSLRSPLVAAVFVLGLGSVLSAQTLTTLYGFQSGVDGGFPFSGVTPDGTGGFYVTTPYGGTASTLGGTVQRLRPPTAPGSPWTKTLLYSFASITDGAQPNAAVLVGSSGELYGTFQNLNGQPSGGLFQLTPPAVGSTWTQTLLWTNLGVTNTEIIRDSSGALLTTTTGGGAQGAGSIVRFVPRDRLRDTKQVLYSFTGGSDGGQPQCALIMDADENLYGTTSLGGNNSAGVVFRLAKPRFAAQPWTYTVLHRFNDVDGRQPYTGLTMDASGALYGVTFFGGTNNKGVVFRMEPPASPGGEWIYTVLHHFDGTDGAYPSGEMVFDQSGALYGTTSDANLSGGLGTIFKLTRPAVSGNPWTFQQVHKFQNTDGERPTGRLTIDASGVLYGTTYYGGPVDAGTVYSLQP